MILPAISTGQKNRAASRMIEIIGGPTDGRDYGGVLEMAEKMGCPTNGRDDKDAQQMTEDGGAPQMTEIRMPNKWQMSQMAFS